MLRLNDFLVYLIVLGLICGETIAEPPPSPQIINDKIDSEHIDWQKFQEDSFIPRMQFELTGRLLIDKASFCEFVSIARNQFERDFNHQQSMLEQIQNYEGTDWEELYGSTGLWRSLASSVEKTRLDKAWIEYYFTIFCSPEKQKDYEKILNDLGWPKQNKASEILISKILCALAKIDKKYENDTAQLFSKLKLRSDLDHCDTIKIAIEQIQCSGVAQKNETQSLLQNECQNDRELVFSFANLQRKFAPDGLQNTLSRRPETAILMDKLLLDELLDRFSKTPANDVNLSSINPVDAELAATAALSSSDNLQKARDISNVITKIADNEKFQTPAVVYLAAAMYGQENPKKSVEFLIKASILQAKNKNVFLPSSAEDLAKRAFDIAYQEFLKDPNNCKLAIDAYENYSRIAPTKIDEQTRYLYANLLNNCDKTDEAIKNFKSLAGQTQNLWRDAANLELLKIELSKAKTPAETNEILNRLHDFILSCTRPEERETQIRLEALNLYCTTLLEQDSNDAAKKVLKILDEAPPTPGVPYEFYWARAYWQLDRIEEAAIFMSKAVDMKYYSSYEIFLVADIIDRIELWQQTAADYNQLLANCQKIDESHFNFDKDRQIFLYLSEIQILQGKTQGTLAPQGDDIEDLRVQARLFMAQNDFNQAAMLWSKIAEEKRNEPAAQNEKSYGWWQAKYYELYCLAKSPSAKRDEIRHTIEVLENTYSNIPAPWAEKLDSLKR